MPKPTERVAITLIDLNGLSTGTLSRYLGGRVKTPLSPITIEETVRGVTLPVHLVELSGDLLGCALACDLIRAEQKQLGSHVMRIRVHRGRGWMPVGTDDVLSLNTSDGICLNPEWFPSQVKYYSEQDTPQPVRITPQTQR